MYFVCAVEYTAYDFSAGNNYIFSNKLTIQSKCKQPWRHVKMLQMFLQD